MEKNSIAITLKEILCSILEHENFEIKNELKAKDVDGWDSLSHMLIISEIEKKFDIKFKLKELNKINNLGNLLELIKSKIVEK
tara:strand:+ start:2786 stop:3034 length:249 start_codon:yes stop_codon:yes gene_type:complete